MISIKSIFIALFLLISTVVNAQKVGLVLSGGGAKGLYHIGVIKALEENGIPIDYISGTSMGSIIGGLYAIGYTPDQMKEEFLSEQIKYWMSGKIEPKYQYYFKRMRENASMINIRLDFKNPRRIARIPTNIVPSNQIDMAFIDYFASSTVACESDFNKLFVPFRCVATDAINRRPVIYNSGDLGKAIRTSMTIPFIFKPIRNDSTLLYDGGIYNNFPWQVLDEDFKPDILIGSKCVEGHKDPDENSFMDQVFALTMMHTDYELPANRGIMIDRIFDDVTMLDFSKADYIIQKGYDDATVMMEQIKERISRRVEPSELAARRAEFKSRMPKLLFNGYEIEGLGLRQTGYVRKLLKLDRGDSVYSFNQFRTEYFKILSEGEIESDYPDVTYNRNTNLFNLSIGMKTKPSFKIMFGGNISSTALNQAYVGLEYKQIGHTAQSYNFDGYFSAFYTSMSLGARSDFFIGSPFYYEYGLSYNYYNYFRSNYGFLSKGHDLTYSKYKDIYATISAGMPIGRQSVLNIRGNIGQNDYRYFQIPGYDEADTMDRTQFNFTGAKIELERNNLENAYSIRGIRQSLSMMIVNGREKYAPGSTGNLIQPSEDTGNRFWFGAKIVREHYLPMYSIKWFSLGYLAEATLTTHPSFFNEYSTNISSPAFTPTPHSKVVYMKEFRSPSYVAIGVMPIFEFSPNFYLKNSVYVFMPENYNVVKEGIRQRFRYIFDSSLVYQTLVGPVSLSLSKYDVSRNNWFITFNFGYAIFNKKGLFY